MVAGQMSNVSYQYDAADRLADVDGVSYVYDANGNLLNDGQNTYAYDSANRLTSVLGPSSSSQYAYSGLGDRLSQNGTQYTLDLNSGLTQVLDDGTTSYTYGLGRISQHLTLDTGTPDTSQYFLGDALGSVRQLTNSAGEVTFAKAYDPYGNVTQSSGVGQSAYGYTGEQQSNDMVYLRSRFYNVSNGRFQSRDTWEGDYNSPITFNKWAYANGNPVLYTDPSGKKVYNDSVDILLYNTGSDPISNCLALLSGLAFVDGPFIVGDVAGILGCLLIVGAAYGGSVALHNSGLTDEFVDTCTVTWEKLLENVATETKPEPTPKPWPTLPPLPPKLNTPMPDNAVYRLGGKTSVNLTPRIIDIEGAKPGLSLTTTPGKGWKISGGKNALLALGFLVIPDRNALDPGHFVIQPGPSHQASGWTLLAWAQTREFINEADPFTWHPLTSMLRSISQ